MPALMRCIYCGILQDEPAGAKVCRRCGGELVFEMEQLASSSESYIQVQMELDQVKAPANQNFDRYLLVTLQSPSEIPAAHAAPEASARQPIIFTAVLDVSGSMGGPKLAQAKEAIHHALHRLHDGDYFALVTFSSDVKCVMAPAELNSHTRKVVASALDEIQATGMTALAGGLEMGITQTVNNLRATSMILLLSDGQANVGQTDLEKIGYTARQAQEKGVTISTLGVGRDYNEALMVEIALQAGGRYYHVVHPEQISPYLTGELGEVLIAAARQAKITLEIPAEAVITPLSAAYRITQGDGRASVKIGDIPRALELEIPLRLSLPALPPGERVSVSGTLNYRSPAGKNISTKINRVTIRVLDRPSFAPRDGVVTPVVERVLKQMKAANILSISRVLSRATGDREQQRETSISQVRAYAALLGNERAELEARQFDRDYGVLTASPAAAKKMVSSAFSTQRSTKAFDRDNH